MKSTFIIRFVSEVEHNLIIIKERTILMVKKILKWLGGVIFIVFLGFIGGCLSPFVISKIRFLFEAPPAVSISDSISIANTYIVFTTFIFTAIAIIVAVASYLFSQEAAKSRQIQENTLFSDLIENCNKNEEQGKKLLSKLLENESVLEHFEGMVKERLDILVEEHLKKVRTKKDEAEAEINALKTMIDKKPTHKEEK